MEDGRGAGWDSDILSITSDGRRTGSRIIVTTHVGPQLE